MSCPSRSLSILLAAALISFIVPAHAADYRGMTPGWPSYANGYYAANYPTNYGGAAYFVARPVSAQTAYYAGGAPRAVAYVPVRAAYSNPTYFAAYGVPAAANRAPAGYYPAATTAYYAPQQTSYYPPTATNYAPTYSYAVTPAGSVSAGSEPAASYAQPMAVNYVPARYTYRPAYAAVPVYMARPVTAYSPVMAAQPVTYYQPATCQPTTCYQPAPATGCGSSSRHPLAWLHPFNWFRRSSCGTGGCGAAPTTAYCGTMACQPSGCGQPYYPAVAPSIPVVPAPAATAPTFTPVPSGTYITPAQPRVPSPPTRTPGTLAPADLAPRITPGTGSFTPLPGSTITPGTPITPGTTITPGSGFPTPSPGTGSFPTGPSSTAPAFGTPGTFVPGTSFPSGTNYPPTGDPYSTAPSSTTLQAPRAASPTTHHAPATASDRGLIRAPELGSPLAPSVQTVPDPDVRPTPQPLNRAPQLLDPRDRAAARGDLRWAVVPAIWPTKSEQVHAEAGGATIQKTASFQINPADYDDSGWRSAR